MSEDNRVVCPWCQGECMVEADGPQPVAEPQRQPIETAPRDGTVILAWGEFEDAEEPVICWYDEKDSNPGGALPHGPFVWKQYEASSIARDCIKAWMPLPDPHRHHRDGEG
jgi:hypothetical protein